MFKTFVYIDLCSIIEIKLSNSNRKIKMVGSKNVPTICVNTQELNCGHKAAKRLSLYLDQCNFP